MIGRKHLDLFSGARGWCLGARGLGLWTAHDGVEHWDVARATAEAAGFTHVGEDVRDFRTAPGEYDLHTASPSCKTWTLTGNGKGREALRDILHALIDLADGRVPDLRGLDPDAALVIEPLRLALEGWPRALAWEQVPSALKVWEHSAHILRERGYKTWTGVVDAADFGVPQNRKRAVLLARRDGAAMFGPEQTTRGANVPMAQALGWPENAYVVSNNGTGGDASRRGVRWATQPSFTITSKADRNKIWRVEGPGRNTLLRNLTHAEAAALQTFPPGHPFRGTKAEIGEQIGNAVPPRLAEGLLWTLSP